MRITDLVHEPFIFGWDKGNLNKSFERHGITNEESEEAFSNRPIIFGDLKHSQKEERYHCLGSTDGGKKLFISFTIRKGLIWIISARDRIVRKNLLMNKILKKIPKFKSEEEERDFWDSHDSTDYIDWSKAHRIIFTNLKLTKRPISLRITDSLLAKVKVLANKKDMPYQTLMKQYIYKGVEEEMGKYAI